MLSIPTTKDKFTNLLQGNIAAQTSRPTLLKIGNSKSSIVITIESKSSTKKDHGREMQKIWWRKAGIPHRIECL
jgi:hypothetical protein